MDRKSMKIIKDIIKIELRKLFEEKNSDKKSIGLFFRLPENIAEKFPNERLEQDDSPNHISFIYIGTENSEKDNDKMIGVIHRCISEMPSCKAILEDVDYFQNEDFIIPHVKIRFEPDIREWKEKIQTELEKSGFKIKDEFPEYKPHSTLAYIDKPEEDEEYEWEGEIPTGEFEISEIELWGLDKDYIFQLKSSSNKT